MSKEEKIEATLAFIFNKDLTKVLLIKKKKPVYHAGMLNGLGGKLEPGETHLECVIREIEEEAGFITQKKDWIKVGFLTWSIWRVSVWTGVYDSSQEKTTNFPEEGVGWHDARSLSNNVIENLHWLIPLCIDVNQKVLNKEETRPYLRISYK